MTRRAPRRMRAAAAAVAALAATLALAACGGDSDLKGSVKELLGTAASKCPRGVVLNDARHLVDVAAGGTGVADARIAASIGNLTVDCDGKSDGLHIVLSVPFDVRRGPKLESGSLVFSLPYFVAVTDRYGKVLAKRVFEVPVTMGGDQKGASAVEQVEQLIPPSYGKEGTEFVIYAGFQLTAEQLDFNRRNRL